MGTPETQQMKDHLEGLLMSEKKCHSLFTMNNLMRIIYILLIAFTFFNCSSQKSITLYVTNIKETELSVHLKIYVNNSLYVNNNFKYSKVTPNYDVYMHKFDKGIHTLKVLKGDSELLVDTFNLKKDMFIYVSYGEGIKGEGTIFLKKTTVNYKLH